MRPEIGYIMAKRPRMLDKLSLQRDGGVIGCEGEAERHDAVLLPLRVRRFGCRLSRGAPGRAQIDKAARDRWRRRLCRWAGEYGDGFMVMARVKRTRGVPMAAIMLGAAGSAAPVLSLSRPL